MWKVTEHTRGPREGRCFCCKAPITEAQRYRVRALKVGADFVRDAAHLGCVANNPSFALVDDGEATDTHLEALRRQLDSTAALFDRVPTFLEEVDCEAGHGRVVGTDGAMIAVEVDGRVYPQHPRWLRFVAP